MATIYKGYRMESDFADPISNVTIKSPSGKLVHTYQFNRTPRETRYAIEGVRWIEGLENREDDPGKPAQDAMMEVLGFAKALTPDTRGETPCPLCKTGTVVCMKSSYNGHTRGRCSNAKCEIGWIE